MTPTDESCPREPILIYASSISGHRLAYAAYLVEHAVERGLRTIVALPAQSQETPEFRVHLGGLKGRVAMTESGRAAPTAIATCAAAVGAHQIVVPDGDAIALALGRGARFRSASKMTLLIMRTRVYGHGAVINEIMTVARIACLRLASLRPNVRLVYLVSPFSRNLKGVNTAVDPIVVHADGSSHVRAAMSETPGRRWIGIIGALDARKNFDMVAQAVILAGAEDFGVAVIGRIAPSYSDVAGKAIDALRASGAVVLVDNRTVTDGEIDDAIAAVDCVVLAHTNEGPSGILGKAAALQTRIVAAGARSLRSDSSRIDGAVWCRLKPQAIANALVAVGNCEPANNHTSISGPREFAEAILGYTQPRRI